MIKIYHWDLTLEDESTQSYMSDNYAYNITENDDESITLDIKIPFKGNSKEVTYNLDVSSNKGTVVDLIVSDTSDSARVVPFYVYDYVDRYSGYTLPMSNSDGFIKVARVIIDDSANVFISLTYKCYDVDGFDNVAMDAREYSSKYYLMRDCEWFATLVSKLNKKRALISKTDIYRSASYIEDQVDVLTKLVLDLIKGNAVDEDKLKLLEKANEYSVLTIKPDDAVSEEFTVNKANFRKIQEQYYESLK